MLSFAKETISNNFDIMFKTIGKNQVRYKSLVMSGQAVRLKKDYGIDEVVEGPGFVTISHHRQGMLDFIGFKGDNEAVLKYSHLIVGEPGGINASRGSNLIIDEFTQVNKMWESGLGH